MYASMLMTFFFNDTATTEIYTLSLHDALPIYRLRPGAGDAALRLLGSPQVPPIEAILTTLLNELADLEADAVDRKSTRLNSSHANISYAVFCLKKKNDKHGGMQRVELERGIRI